MLICLIGRHGSGKSTLGKLLSELGFYHVCVGLLRRLAVRGEYPADVPFELMRMMKQLAPGQVLPDAVAKALLAHAVTRPMAVIDGFPATAAQVAMLPAGTQVILVWCPKVVREGRLVMRATMTRRKWVAGRESAREMQLAELVLACRKADQRLGFGFLPNRDDGLAGLTAAARRLAIGKRL